MRDALLLGFILFALLAAIRYPFAGVLAWTWFVLLTPHQMAYGAFGVPLNVVIAAATLVAVALSGAWRAFRLDSVTVLLLLFAGWLAVSQGFSLKPDNSAIYFDRFIKIIVYALIVAQLATDKLKFHALCWMLVAAGVYFGVKGALFTLITLGEFRVQGLERTILEDNNHMGIALAALLPMILYLRGEAAHGLMRHGLTVAFALTTLAIVGTHSRGAFVALAAFGFYFWLRSRRKLLILAALATLAAPVFAFMPAKYGERISTIASAGADPSFMGRVDAWVVSAKLAAAHPLTGAGLRNSYEKDVAASVDPARAETAKAAHSIYFEVLGGAGFVGLALYLGLFAAALLSARALRRKAHGEPAADWRGRFGYYAEISLVVFMIGGATVSMEMWDGYLLVMALIAAASKMCSADRDAPLRAPALLRWRALSRTGGQWRSSAAPSPSGESRTGR